MGGGGGGGGDNSDRNFRFRSVVTANEGSSRAQLTSRLQEAHDVTTQTPPVSAWGLSLAMQTVQYNYNIMCVCVSE